jgi:predicted nucleic acid-binding protein
MFTLELQKEVQEQFYTLAFLVSVYKEFKNKAMEYEKNGDIKEYQKWTNIAGLIFELIRER